MKYEESSCWCFSSKKALQPLLNQARMTTCQLGKRNKEPYIIQYDYLKHITITTPQSKTRFNPPNLSLFVSTNKQLFCLRKTYPNIHENGICTNIWLKYRVNITVNIPVPWMRWDIQPPNNSIPGFHTRYIFPLLVSL